MSTLQQVLLTLKFSAMDQGTFVFATKGHSIKDKQCQHIALKNKICVCVQVNLAYFPFLVANRKVRWSIETRFCNFQTFFSTGSGCGTVGRKQLFPKPHIYGSNPQSSTFSLNVQSICMCLHLLRPGVRIPSPPRFIIYLVHLIETLISR